MDMPIESPDDESDLDMLCRMLNIKKSDMLEDPSKESGLDMPIESPDDESDLDMLCRMLNIKKSDMPDDPSKKLRGLLSEFDIKESATEIVRDIRDNRRP